MLPATTTPRHRWPGAFRRSLPALVPLAAAAMVGYLILTRGSSLLAALAAVPPWVLAAAVGAHLLTLALRTNPPARVISTPLLPELLRDRSAAARPGKNSRAKNSSRSKAFGISASQFGRVLRAQY